MFINKILTSFIFSSLLVTTVESSPFLNEDETRIALDVINQLRVHHCIFYVHNEETRDSDVFKNFKSFSSKSLATKIIRNETDLIHDVFLSSFYLKSFENDKMIIMKSENISLVQDLLTEARKVSSRRQFQVTNLQYFKWSQMAGKWHRIKRAFKYLLQPWKNDMANFKWLYFLEDPDLHVIFNKDNPIEISYNCEFIFVQRDTHLPTYVLREAYAINDRLFCNKVGKWVRFQGLVQFNDVPIRLRRKNLKRSQLEVYTPEVC